MAANPTRYAFYYAIFYCEARGTESNGDPNKDREAQLVLAT